MEHDKSSRIGIYLEISSKIMISGCYDLMMQIFSSSSKSKPSNFFKSFLIYQRNYKNLVIRAYAILYKKKNNQSSFGGGETTPSTRILFGSLQQKQKASFQ